MGKKIINKLTVWLIEAYLLLRTFQLVCDADGENWEKALIVHRDFR